MRVRAHLRRDFRRKECVEISKIKKRKNTQERVQKEFEAFTRYNILSLETVVELLNASVRGAVVNARRVVVVRIVAVISSVRLNFTEDWTGKRRSFVYHRNRRKSFAQVPRVVENDHSVGRRESIRRSFLVSLSARFAIFSVILALVVGERLQLA